MPPMARRKAPMASKGWARIAGVGGSPSPSTARDPSICAAFSSWATRRSVRRGFISISHKAEIAGNTARDIAHRQRVLIHIWRHQITGLPREEQKDRVVGLVRKAILRIGGGDQLAALGVVAGCDEFGDALVLRRLEQRDLRHRDRRTHRQRRNLQRRNADQKRFFVGGQCPRRDIDDRLGLAAVVHHVQSLAQELGANGAQGIAIVITLEILAIDKDLGAFWNGQRKLRGGAVGGGGNQQLLGGGAQGNARTFRGAGTEEKACRQAQQQTRRRRREGIAQQN